jgi:uncharacterized cupin superfamily protein
MGYTVVSPEEVRPDTDRPSEVRRLAEAAGLSNVAVNVFRADPGEQIPRMYHYHDVQEEAFYVLSGTMLVETPEGTYRVESESLFTASPKSPHRAYNPSDGDDAIEVLAIGAPPVDGDANRYEPDENSEPDGANTDGATPDEGSDEAASDGST